MTTERKNDRTEQTERERERKRREMASGHHNWANIFPNSFSLILTLFLFGDDLALMGKTNNNNNYKNFLPEQLLIKSPTSSPKLLIWGPPSIVWWLQIVVACNSSLKRDEKSPRAPYKSLITPINSFPISTSYLLTCYSLSHSLTQLITSISSTLQSILLEQNLHASTFGIEGGKQASTHSPACSHYNHDPFSFPAGPLIR